MSHIESWEDATWVYTFGPGSVMTIAFCVLAVAVVVAFLVQMVRHENHAYAQMLHREPVEPGPAVEGEPKVY